MTEFFTVESRYDGLGIAVVVVRPDGEPRAADILRNAGYSGVYLQTMMSRIMLSVFCMPTEPIRPRF